MSPALPPAPRPTSPTRPSPALAAPRPASRPGEAVGAPRTSRPQPCPPRCAHPHALPGAAAAVTRLRPSSPRSFQAAAVTWIPRGVRAALTSLRHGGGGGGGGRRRRGPRLLPANHPTASAHRLREGKEKKNRGDLGSARRSGRGGAAARRADSSHHGRLRWVGVPAGHTLGRRRRGAGGGSRSGEEVKREKAGGRGGKKGDTLKKKKKNTGIIIIIIIEKNKCNKLMSFQVKLPSAPPRSGREGSAKGVNFFLPPVPPGPSQRPAAAPPPPAPPRRSRRHPAARRRGVPHARSRRRRGSWFAEPPEEGKEGGRQGGRHRGRSVSAPFPRRSGSPGPGGGTEPPGGLRVAGAALRGAGKCGRRHRTQHRAAPRSRAGAGLSAHIAAGFAFIFPSWLRCFHADYWEVRGVARFFL